MVSNVVLVVQLTTNSELTSSHAERPKHCSVVCTLLNNKKKN